MDKVYNTEANNSTTKNTKSSENIADTHDTLQNFEMNMTFQLEYEPEDEQGQWLLHSFSRNSKLSFACRGFLVYLFSHKPGFIINLKAIQNNVCDIEYSREKGRDYIRRLAKEAEDHGYLSKKYYLVNGLRRFRYIVHKKPVSQIPKNNLLQNSKKSLLDEKNTNSPQETHIFQNMFARDGITGAGITVPLRISKDKEKDNIEKDAPLAKPRPKATAPSSPIILLFSYKYKHRATGNIFEVENGVKQDEYTELIKLIGEDNLRKTCRKMKEWAEAGQFDRRFSNKKLFQKIIDWNRDRLASENRQTRQRKDQETIKQDKELVQTKINAFLTEINNKCPLISSLIGINRFREVLILQLPDGKSIEICYSWMNEQFFEKFASWRKLYGL